MEDPIAFKAKRRENAMLPEAEFIAFQKFREIRRARCGQVIHADNFIAFAEQKRNEICPDETRAACYQNFHLSAGSNVSGYDVAFDFNQNCPEHLVPRFG